jgi:hypothetical protein
MKIATEPVKLQLVMGSDEGQEETVPDVITLNKTAPQHPPATPASTTN